MRGSVWLAVAMGLAAGAAAVAAEGPAGWALPQWRFRTRVERLVPYRDGAPRPVEVAVDFPLVLRAAGMQGTFDPGSVRVVPQGGGEPVPYAWREEFDARGNRRQAYLSWLAHPQSGRCAAYDIYFDTADRGLPAARYPADRLPPENLVQNGGFEQWEDGMPASWECRPARLVRSGRFTATAGQRSLKLVVDRTTPDEVDREVTISQRINVSRYAGQELVFQCDLLAERAAYGAPVSIELVQYRADGSRIMEYAVDPRWLTLELAEGQLVRFSQRGRFSHEAAELEVRIRMRLWVRDADTGQRVSGPESWFTVWLDRVVVRPGERWPWPAASGAGYVAGALPDAPANRAFRFIGLRRVVFNGASEGTLSGGRYNPDPRSVHWGLLRGTLEFWCRPAWPADDRREHVFFEGIAYGHRLQSRLRRLVASGVDQLEFAIADSNGVLHTVRGRGPFAPERWHHVAATWDFGRAALQIFVDGRLVASQGPGQRPWPASLRPDGDARLRGMGIGQNDRRTMPMQAFIGGDRDCSPWRSAQADIDELRISDTVRYSGPFEPRRAEFAVDEHTRALFHFENQPHGVHEGDDRFVRGHPACELAPQRETAPLEIFEGGRLRRMAVVVRPHAPAEVFENNRAERRLVVTRPQAPPPDPRRIACRLRQVERTVRDMDDSFTIDVGGDLEPLMASIAFERVGQRPETTWLPRWRAGDNVVPFSAASLAATLAPEAHSDAEKALEVFRYALATTNYYDAPYCETLPTRHRPRVSYTLIKALNIYPFDQCGPLNHMLRKMFLCAGISSNDASGTHHQFEQAFYDGDYRLFDLSPRLYWLKRDNRTVASRRDFEEDLYLKLRQGSGVMSGLRGRVSRARFGVAERPHRMDFPLRPGERASVCWHNEGRWFELTEDRRPIPLAKIPPLFGNGAIEFQPVPRGDAVVLQNVTVTTEDGQPVVRLRDAARPGWLVYRVHCPYILAGAAVRGAYQAARPGAVRLALSFDQGKTWQDVWKSPGQQGTIDASLQDQLSARYAYWLRVYFDPDRDAAVRGLRVRSSFVVSPLSLPGRLRRGVNRIRFVGGPVTVPVRTVCRWVERRRSDLAVSLNAIGYYSMVRWGMNPRRPECHSVPDQGAQAPHRWQSDASNGDQVHRNMFVAAPGDEVPVRVTLSGAAFDGPVRLTGLPPSWSASSEQQAVKTDGQEAVAELAIRVPDDAAVGTVIGFWIVIGDGEPQRRIAAQLLVAPCPLVAEAEAGLRGDQGARLLRRAYLSGAAAVQWTGRAQIAFETRPAEPGRYALWLRARWDDDADRTMRLVIDGKPRRTFSPAAMIGFTDWSDPHHAHTKMFAHFGQQYGHWSWYRLPEVDLSSGRHQVGLEAGAGAELDAVLLLPQSPPVDRAAMNLLQNWNYAPWDNPF